MKALQLEMLATAENFDEAAYLLCNPDVKAAVARGELDSGRQHWEIFGRNEQRKLRSPGPALVALKREKHLTIAPLLRTDLPYVHTVDYHDFLSAELRQQFDIVATDAVSGHPYDSNVRDLIARHAADGYSIAVQDEGRRTTAMSLTSKSSLTIRRTFKASARSCLSATIHSMRSCPIPCWNM